jgi:hypothetical protein
MFKCSWRCCNYIIVDIYNYLQVIDNCEKIPMYSRVGVFSKLNYYDYDTNIRKCGVFLGCLKTGSKVTGVKVRRYFYNCSTRFYNSSDGVILLSSYLSSL